VLIGDPPLIARKALQLGLRLRQGIDYEVMDPANNPHFHTHWKMYHERMSRKGVSPDYAQAVVRSRPTVLASLMLKNGEADALLCGSIGRYQRHLQHVSDVVGLCPTAHAFAAMNALVLNRGTYFITDTYVNPDPSAEVLAESTLLAAAQVRRFGLDPKVALISHSNFGSMDTVTSRKMQEVLQIVRARDPELEVEGEMHSDAALSADIRDRIFPASRLTGEANLLVMPTLDAANIAFNMVKILGEGLTIGPILLGAAQPAHIMTPSVTVRGIVNMTAFAVVDAGRNGN
jgi:malate dehydrogenase (oxaloacetate-decarboxylating)(NADP+)